MQCSLHNYIAKNNTECQGFSIVILVKLFPGFFHGYTDISNDVHRLGLPNTLQNCTRDKCLNKMDQFSGFVLHC